MSTLSFIEILFYFMVSLHLLYYDKIKDLEIMRARRGEACVECILHVCVCACSCSVFQF